MPLWSRRSRRKSATPTFAPLVAPEDLGDGGDAHDPSPPVSLDDTGVDYQGAMEPFVASVDRDYLVAVGRWVNDEDPGFSGHQEFSHRALAGNWQAIESWFGPRGERAPGAVARLAQDLADQQEIDQPTGPIPVIGFDPWSVACSRFRQSAEVAGQSGWVAAPRPTLERVRQEASQEEFVETKAPAGDPVAFRERVLPPEVDSVIEDVRRALESESARAAASRAEVVAQISRGEDALAEIAEQVRAGSLGIRESMDHAAEGAAELDRLVESARNLLARLGSDQQQVFTAHSRSAELLLDTQDHAEAAGRARGEARAAADQVLEELSAVAQDLSATAMQLEHTRQEVQGQAEDLRALHTAARTSLVAAQADAGISADAAAQAARSLEAASRAAEQAEAQVKRVNELNAAAIVQREEITQRLRELRLESDRAGAHAAEIEQITVQARAAGRELTDRLPAIRREAREIERVAEGAVAVEPLIAQAMAAAETGRSRLAVIEADAVRDRERITHIAAWAADAPELIRAEAERINDLVRETMNGAQALIDGQRAAGEEAQALSGQAREQMEMVASLAAEAAQTIEDVRAAEKDLREKAEGISVQAVLETQELRHAWAEVVESSSARINQELRAAVGLRNELAERLQEADALLEQLRSRSEASASE